MKSPSAKGKILENYVTERLRASGLDPRAYPQRGSGNGKNKGDIWNALDIHFECKNHKNFGGKAWFNQMREENVSNLVEVLVWKPGGVNLDETKVIVDWAYFEELLLRAIGAKVSTESVNLKWPVQRLRDAAKEVLKHIDHP